MAKKSIRERLEKLERERRFLEQAYARSQRGSGWDTEQCGSVSVTLNCRALSIRQGLNFRIARNPLSAVLRA
jgi:hypothetical protein